MYSPLQGGGFTSGDVNERMVASDLEPADERYRTRSRTW
jgi:hypothetical protein